MGDIKFYSPVDFDDTSSGVTIEGNLIANANVGIGTASPATPLDVTGAGRFSGHVRSNFLNTYDNSKSIIGAPSNYVSIYGGSGTEAIRIDSSNNVGIGTTSPSEKLEVDGNIKSKRITLSHSGYAGYIDQAGDFGGGPLYIRNRGQNHDINFQGNKGGTTSTSLHIDGLTHNIGIGTTSPGELLHLESTEPLIRLDDTNSGLHYIFGQDGDGFKFTTNNSTYGKYTFDTNVGIGTTNPGAKLHVFNAGYPQMALQSNGGTWQVGVSTGNDLAFRRGTSGSNYPLWLDSSDNVGIGTTSPSQKLHVDGNARITGAIYDSNNDPGTSGQILSSTVTGTDWIDQGDVVVGSAERAEILVKNLQGSALSKGDPIYIIGSVGASARLQVGLADAGNSSKMPCAGLLSQDLAINGEGYATVTGKLKNLITSPIDGATPSVNDTIYVKSGGGLTLTKPTGVSNLIQNVGQIGRVSTSSDGNIVVSAILRTNDIPNLTTGKIWVGDGNTIESTVVHLDETNGRMGVGTTSPTTSLHVDGNIRVGDSADVIYSNRFNGLSNTDVSISSNSGYAITFNEGVSEKMRIASSGNIGIGTTSPGAKLHVHDDDGAIIRLSSNAHTDQNKIEFDALNNGTVYHSIVSNTSTGNLQLRAGDSGGGHEVNIYTDGSFAATFDSNQNLGVGTTSPSRKLSVYQSSSSMVADFRSASGNDSFISFSNNASTADQVRLGSSSGNLILSTNYTERMRIDSAGNVGIGVTAPSAAYRLDIGGGDIYVRDAVAKITLGQFGSQGDAHFGASGIGSPTVGSQDYGFYSAHNAYRTSTGAWKHSRTSTIPAVRLLGSGGVSQGNQGFSFDYSPNVGLADITWSNLMKILPSGNVGIGTTSPGVKLDVTGQIRASSGLEISGGNINLIDNSRIRLGSSVDFQIYHDGSNSYITDTGTGDLYIRGSNSVYIGNSAGTKTYISGTDGGATKLYYNGAGAQQKLETTSTGITVIGDGYSESSWGVGTNTTPVGKIRNNSGIFDIRAEGARQISFSNVTNGELIRINATGNVGIGTTSPVEKLDISAGNIRLDDNQRITWSTNDSNIGRVRITGNESSDFLTFVTDNSERVRVDSSGNVGIGTTSPAQKLHINGNFLLENNKEIRQKDSGGNQRTIIELDSSNDLNIGGSYAGALKFIGGGSYAEVMRIHDNGNVGIGTTNPTSDLFVNSSANVGFTLQHASRPTLALTDGTNSSYIGLESGGAIITGTSDNDLSIRSPRNIVFGGNSVARMTIQNAGNVGIGTTGPVRPLHINSASTSLARFTTTSTGVTDSDGVAIGFDDSLGGVFWNRESSNLVFATNNSEVVRITSTGNVGIGTTSPDFKLDVAGDIGIDGKIYHNGDHNTYIGFSADTQTFRTGGSDQVTINNTGVGIGTTNPSEKLSVDGNVEITTGGNTYLNVNHGNVGFIKFTDTSIASPNQFLIQHNYAQNNDFRIARATGGSDLVINSSGNVGIGTTSPSHKLDIYSNENVPLRVHRPSNANLNSDGAWGIGFSTRGDAATSTSDTRAGIFSYYNGNLFLAAANTSIVADPIDYARLTVLNTGNVGIGTTSPSSKLHVQGTSFFFDQAIFDDKVGIGTTSPGAKLHVSAASSNSQLILERTGTGTGKYNIHTNTNNLYINNVASSTYPLTILNSGNVGIGTTIPGYKLEISDDTDTTVNLLRLRNADSLYSQTWDFQLDTGKHLVVTGGSSAGGIVLKPGSAGLNVTSTSAAQIFLNSATGNDSVLNFQENSSQKGKIGYDTSLSGIALVTGSGAFSSADMVVLDSGNVGIGTTSPAGRLELNGNGNNWATAPAVRMWDSNNSKGWLVGNVNNVTAGDFYIRTLPGEDANPGSSQQEFTIKHATGNVGIGTTSPGEKLTVHSTATAISSFYTTNSAGGFTSYQNSTGGVKGFVGYGSTLFTGLDINNFGLRSQSGMPFATGGGNVRMYINSSGNVGIGTTSPAAPLSISNSSSETLEFNNSISSQSRILSYDRSDNSYRDLVLDGLDIIFKRQSSETVRIASSGNVGIGTTSPTSFNSRGRNLVVNSDGDTGITISANTTSSSTLLFADSFAGTGGTSTYRGIIEYDHSVDSMAFSTSATERIRITAAGNVGIGTISPGGKLTVKSSGFGTAYNNYDALYIDNGSITAGSGNYGNGIGFSRLGSPTYKKAAIVPVQGTSDEDNLGLAFFTSPNSGFADVVAEAMRINYNGNVGIGTTSPANKLTVRTSTSNDGLYLETSQPVTYGKIYNSNSESFPVGNLNLAYGTNSTAIIQALSNRMSLKGGYTTGGQISFLSASTEIMRMTSTGLGIGTTSPSEKLSIATSTNASAEIGYAHVGYIGHNTYAGFSHVNQNTTLNYAFLQGSNGETYINAPTGQNVNFRINNSTHMVLNNSGNIGIGTTSPSRKLDVVGDAKVSGQTHTGTLRVDATAAGPNPTPNQSPSDAIVRPAGDTAIYLSDPDEWLEININGTNYVIPAYEA